jgi:hypothetical protein
MNRFFLLEASRKNSEVNKQSGIQPEIAGLLKKRLWLGGKLDGNNRNHAI